MRAIQVKQCGSPEALEVADKIAVETDPTARERWQKRYDVVQHELHRLAAYNVDHRVDAGTGARVAPGPGRQECVGAEVMGLGRVAFDRTSVSVTVVSPW